MRKSTQTKLSEAWKIFWRALQKFSQIEGAQSAAAFAHFAFFSLFPLIVLCVTFASAFFEREQAGSAVIAYVESYVPIDGEMQAYIFDTIAGVVNARGKASVIAFLMLVWSALQFFTTLIYAINRAWDAEALNWWRLPLKSLGFLGCMVGVVLLGVVMPVVAQTLPHWLIPVTDFSLWLNSLLSLFVPPLVVFLSLSVFYRLAPSQSPGYSETLIAAVCATALLQVADSFFVIYLRNFAGLNAIYGAFGGIMALLLWIYLSACIVIFGACLGATWMEDHP